MIFWTWWSEVLYPDPCMLSGRESRPWDKMYFQIHNRMNIDSCWYSHSTTAILSGFQILLVSLSNFVYELSPTWSIRLPSDLFVRQASTKLHLRKLLDFLFLYSKMIFDTMFHPTLAEFNLNRSIKVHQIRTTSDLIQCRKHVWKWKIGNLTIFVGVVLYDKCVYTI